jgi:hypothetical protein
MLDEALTKGHTNTEYAEQKLNKDRYDREQAVLDYAEKHPDGEGLGGERLHRMDYDARGGEKKVRLLTPADFKKEVERIKKAREERRKNAYDRTPGTDGKPNEDRQSYGWTTPDQRQTILAENGIESHQEPATLDNMENAVREGKGVMTTHKAGQLWGDGTPGNHVVVVTGMEYDDDGKLVKVVYNDTAVGCHQTMDKDKFAASLTPDVNMNVTEQPVW